MSEALQERETEKVPDEKKYDPRQLNLYRITSLIYQTRKKISEEITTSIRS